MVCAALFLASRGLTLGVAAASADTPYMAFLPAVVAGAVLEPTTLCLMLSAATIAGPGRRAVARPFGVVGCLGGLCTVHR